MNDYYASIFFGIMGALSLCLGICGDCFNFSLALSGRRVDREDQHGRHISPVMLAPVLFNGFGLMCICLALRLPWFYFVGGLLCVIFFHLAGLAAWRR